jgi:hypothetical protein
MDHNLRYAVDIALCIDATGSMYPVIDQVKHAALNFHPDLAEALKREDKHVDELRVKVIVFRDFDADGANAINESKFYRLPDEAGGFSSFVNDIRVDGGGDEPESAYEALALAMQSDWTNSGDRRRHVIVLWTDATVHPIEKSKRSNSVYPQNMPSNFDGLTDLWDGQVGMNPYAKRMVLFAPEKGDWPMVKSHWENVVWLLSQAGRGMEEFDYQSILDQITLSI